MEIIALGALLPSVMLVYLIYKLDRFLEPVGSMIAAFLTGMLSPIVTILISSQLNMGVTQELNPWVYSLTMAAAPEELGRMLLLLWVCERWEAVGEPFDCLVYGATIWAGFAATENILYAIGELKEGGSPISILSIRASLCTFGHTAWGVIMGAFVALYRYSEGKPSKWLVRGLLITITLHMLYDGLLMSVHFGHGVLKVISAVSVDAFSLILASVILIRMRVIQGISSEEGEDQLLQTELFKRHAPDSTASLFEILSHMHIGGVFKVVLGMGLTSLGLGLILNALASSEPIYLVYGALSSLLGFLAWRSVMRLAFEIHQATGAELTQSVDMLKSRKSLRIKWPFKRPPSS